MTSKNRTAVRDSSGAEIKSGHYYYWYLCPDDMSEEVIRVGSRDVGPDGEFMAQFPGQREGAWGEQIAVHGKSSVIYTDEMVDVQIRNPYYEGRDMLSFSEVAGKKIMHWSMETPLWTLVGDNWLWVYRYSLNVVWGDGPLRSARYDGSLEYIELDSPAGYWDFVYFAFSPAPMREQYDLDNFKRMMGQGVVPSLSELRDATEAVRAQMDDAALRTKAGLLQKYLADRGVAQEMASQMRSNAEADPMGWQALQDVTSKSLEDIEESWVQYVMQLKK